MTDIYRTDANTLHHIIIWMFFSINKQKCTNYVFGLIFTTNCPNHKTARKINYIKDWTEWYCFQNFNIFLLSLRNQIHFSKRESIIISTLAFRRSECNYNLLLVFGILVVSKKKKTDILICWFVDIFSD